LVRRGSAEAVLEAHHRRLRQRAVVDLELRLGIRQVRERRIRVSARDVVQHRLAMRVGSTLRVLAGDADADDLHEDRRERKRLGPNTSRGDGCVLITSYNFGCVKLGWSASLCPCRRYPTRSISTSLRNS